MRQNPKKLTKEWIDKWKLIFYRLTSEHHTNLAKIFNNVILLIALFGIFSFGLFDFSSNPPLAGGSKTPINFVFGNLALFPSNIAWIGLLSCLGVWGIYRLCKIGFYGFLALCLIGIVGALGLIFFKMITPPLQEMFLIIGVCLGFVLGYLGLVAYADRGLVLIAYLVCGGILIFKPALLLPFVGKFFDESLKVNFPAMQSLSVVYCILMFLMLFSLQKTAKKNSILSA